MNKIEAFFIDIDGTLIKGHKNIILSVEDKIAIKSAAKKGKYIILSTGRSIEAAKKIWKQIDLPDTDKTSYIVVNNGSTIWDLHNNKILFEEWIEEEAFNALFKYAEEKGYWIKNSLESIFYVKEKPIYNKISKFTGLKFESDFSKVPYNKDSAKKIGIVTHWSKKTVKKNSEEIKALFPNFEIVISGPGLYIEINKKGITKGNAAKFLSEKLNFDLKNSVHIGDSMNDASGFKECGIGVAMGNGMKDLKKHADFITKKIKKSGVASAIDSLLIE